MKLYGYLESLLNDNLMDANGYLLYKGIISEKDLKAFCKKNELRPLTLKEFRVYINRKEIFLLKLLKKIKIDENIRYKFFIHENDYCFYIFKNNIMLSSNDKSIGEGIAILKSSKKEKNYKSPIDLINKPNIGLFIKYESGEIIKIICYDKNILSSYHKIESDHTHPILFYGKIKNDGKDAYGEKTSYGSAMVAISAAREDVSGYNILYPIMAYFSKNNLLIPDRGSVSDAAQSVWKRFSTKGLKLNRFAPIDDINNPITTNEKDDGKIYDSNDGNFISELKDIKNIQKTNKEILNDKNTKETEKRIFLKELRKHDELNWVYRLKSKPEIQPIINELIKNHEEIKKEQKINEMYLTSLAASLFEERRD